MKKIFIMAFMLSLISVCEAGSIKQLSKHRDAEVPYGFARVFCADGYKFFVYSGLGAVSKVRDGPGTPTIGGLVNGVGVVQVMGKNGPVTCK